MPISRKLSSLARTISLAAPLAIAAVPLSAAPVDILSASCVASNTAGLPSDPSNCTSLTSEGHVTEYLQYFSNGFTLSLYANGTAWTSASQDGAFTLDAVVPINLSIDGPTRDLVVHRDSGSSETLSASAGVIGQIAYSFNNVTVLTRTLDGGDPVVFDFENTAPTSTETWTSDSVAGHDFGLSLGLNSSITASSLFGSISESETFHFYEADGVTPVNLVPAQTPEPASLWLLLGSIPVCYLVARKRRSGVPARS